MQRLAADCQVFCVTHLAQVASRADNHLKVSKRQAAEGGAGLVSRVEPLAPAERIEEIARMLGGRRVTQTSRAHASEMLEAGRR